MLCCRSRQVNDDYVITIRVVGAVQVNEKRGLKRILVSGWSAMDIQCKDSLSGLLKPGSLLFKI